MGIFIFLIFSIAPAPNHDSRAIYKHCLHYADLVFLS